MHERAETVQLHRTCACSHTHTHTYIYTDIFVRLVFPRPVISPFVSLFLSPSFSNFLHGLSCNPSAISRTYLVKVSARRRTLARRERERARETSCSTNGDSLKSLIRHFRVLISRAPSRRRIRDDVQLDDGLVSPRKARRIAWRR